MHFEVEIVNRCFYRRCGVGVLEAEKFFCWTLFKHNISCQFFCHFLNLLSAAYIGVTEELVNYPTVDKNHTKHHKTLTHATFF